ncbi:Peptidyl-prolyl cis-trans isomerase FKBP62 [Platanthera zijinensis]|uniref:peptidylprolyl isomerase n=1 Tax=Platanthera zijinensis TaxID=2320716 RepID=A0AAP0G7F6_9ASPA
MKILELTSPLPSSSGPPLPFSFPLWPPASLLPFQGFDHLLSSSLPSITFLYSRDADYLEHTSVAIYRTHLWKPLDKDICKDGGIFKKIFEGEKWENPKDHDEVLDAFGEKGRPASRGEGVVPPNATLLIELELLSWKTVTEIGDDKKVLKKILKEGEGYEKPNDGSTVNGINFSTLILVSC